MEICDLKRRFAQAIFDVQTITRRTTTGVSKILSIIDVFICFVRAVAIPDEKGETVVKGLLEESIPFFGPMERLLSYIEPSPTGQMVPKLAKILRVEHLKVYPLQPKSKRCD